MAATMKSVRAALDPEEPDYAKARRLGAAAIPHLRQLVMGGDQMLATKATYLAGLIGTRAGVALVTQAAVHPNPAVRVAAATAARELELSSATPIISQLLGDSDRGVRQRALRSVGARLTPELQARIEHLMEVDQDLLIRKEAAALIGQSSSTRR